MPPAALTTAMMLAVIERGSAIIIMEIYYLTDFKPLYI